jgi:hypothetical protein
MKRVAILFALFAFTSLPAFADGEVQRIAGTGIVRPPTDAGCNIAINQGRYADALGVCADAAAGYRAIVERLSAGTPSVRMRNVEEQMVYDEAVTRKQIAYAQVQPGHPELGRTQALEVYRLFHVVHDKYWAKVNAAAGRPADDTDPIAFVNESKETQQKLDASLNDDEQRVGAEFVYLIHSVHVLYPDIAMREFPTQEAQSNR